MNRSRSVHTVPYYLYSVFSLFLYMYPPARPDPFDPKALGTPGKDIPTVLLSLPRRARKGRRFYLLSEAQFTRACLLPGPALAVYLFLLNRSRRERSPTVD